MSYVKMYRYQEPWPDASPAEGWVYITWGAMSYLQKPATLAEIYAIVAEHPRAQGCEKATWQAAVREELQSDPHGYIYVGGFWARSFMYKKVLKAAFYRDRCTRLPHLGRPKKSKQ